MSLSEEQRNHFEKRLLEDRSAAVDALNRIIVTSGADDSQDRSGDLSKVPTHPADLGTDVINTEVTNANATRISQELTEMDAALERLHRTPMRYGICEDSGEPIPLARLEIVPWARTCGDAGA